MPLFGQSLPAEDPNRPLTADELRQVLVRLVGCRSCEEQVAVYEDFIAKEKDLCERRLEAERHNAAITTKELDVAKQEALMWKGLYETVKKRRVSAGCWFKRIFSLGIHRCP